MDGQTVGKWVHVPTNVDWADLPASLLILAVFVIAGLGVYHIISQVGRRPAKWRPYAGKSTTTNAADQLKDVMTASFEKKRLLNGGEYKVFRIAEQQIIAHRRGYRVQCQTSLGEIIGSNNRRAFEAINSKRVDILIVSPTGYPVAAIECQGAGHFQRDDTAARDAVKREALRRAGVEFVEIFDHHSEFDIARIVRETLFRADGRSLEQQRDTRPS